jgi:DNA-binding Xre family transcriptional regulator
VSTAKDENGGRLSGKGVDVRGKRSKRYEDAVRRAGKRLGLRLDESGMTQADLSRVTGIDKGSISEILRGEQPEMSVGNFFTLCEALRIDPMLTWYGDTRKPSQSTPPPPESVERPSAHPGRRR